MFKGQRFLERKVRTSSSFEKYEILVPLLHHVVHGANKYDLPRMKLRRTVTDGFVTRASSSGWRVERHDIHPSGHQREELNSTPGTSVGRMPCFRRVDRDYFKSVFSTTGCNLIPLSFKEVSSNDNFYGYFWTNDD